MRLYLFEHCSLCFRVRMTAALKRLHLQETVVLEDDSGTMVDLVGKRVIPILVKDDGVPMLESMDMVAHIDAIGDPVLTGPQRPEIAIWADSVAEIGSADVAALSAPWIAGIRYGRGARPLPCA
jgi:glutaredoxin 2